MKEFNDFIQYAKEHINEIQHDTVSSFIIAHKNLKSRGFENIFPKMGT